MFKENSSDSYIKISSDKVIKACEKTIRDIEEKRQKRNKSIIDRFRKRKGFF